MPISAQMSLWGLHQIDPTILDGLVLPTGMDADNVKDNLLLETESMEVLYTSVPFLKAAITVWAQERLEVWQKLYDTTQLQYNPLDNYDRYEESNAVNTGTASGSSTSVSSATAYNSDDFADTGKGVTNGESRSNSNNVFRSHIRGNIGVMSSQKLLEEERNVAQFCMTEFVINDFISRFCVGVY